MNSDTTSTADDASTTQLVELERADCLRLLGRGGIGRVAVNVPGWPPLIRPVHYWFDQSSQSIVFRSAAGSKLTALLRSGRVAFEIDDLDPAGQVGWSVIVVGPVEEIAVAAELDRLCRGRPGLWLAGASPHCMRLRATVVSGRCLVWTRELPAEH